MNLRAQVVGLNTTIGEGAGITVRQPTSLYYLLLLERYMALSAIRITSYGVSPCAGHETTPRLRFKAISTSSEHTG